MPMNNRILRPLARPLLLDAVPGAAAAYSLRQLSNAYTGPVVTVRRSSDNAEADFTASEIDDGTLTAFCGAGDGLVKTWHDQSGNGRDGSQGTAASQPKIVSSGSLVTESGKAAVEFDGVNDHLRTANVQSTGVLSAFLAVKSNAWHGAAYRCAAAHGYEAATSTTKGAGILLLTSSTTQDWLQYDAISFGSGYPSTRTPRAIGPIASGSDMRLASALLGSSVASLHINGALASTRVSTIGSIVSVNAPITVGASFPTGDFWDGRISEFVLYLADASANRERIERDINRHFGIF
jgi:hypothetical protein